jgi:hypothetical protein
VTDSLSFLDSRQQVPWLQDKILDDQLVFKISSLQFNIETSVLAVGLVATYKETHEVHSQYVQLYHRNNYHWYLKQQWSGASLSFGRFDSELPDRLFLTERHSLSGFGVRSVEFVWDSCTSDSEDCTAAVVDGRKILMTPLGKALVPPPMSLYSLDLPSPSRDISFWCNQSESDQTVPWGLACLCDGDLLRLFTTNSDKPISRGQPSLGFEDINLSLVAQESNLDWSCSVRSVRAVQLDQTESESSNLALVCVATVPMTADLDCEVVDKVLVLKKEEVRGQSVWRMEEYPILSAGSILRLISWADEKNCVGIALSSASEPFEVVKMTIGIDIQFSREFLFSEPCARRLAVVKVRSDNDTQQLKYLCFGLTSTPHSSRLYCCDNLLSSSHISSFVINSSLGVILYVTSTSKPMLHFASLPSLSRIVDDIESNLLAGEAANQPFFTFAAPRPVERGARLVGSPLNSATVILQIPRGNLEGCEPRPLVLMKSRILLSQKKYLECLLLLRRQRVDLNLLVDHHPTDFLNQIPELVPLMIKTNPELLPLLISALENGNVSAQKYPLPEIYQENSLSQSTSVLGNSLTFAWENKVNPVCEHIRITLYHLLQESSLSSNGMKIDDILLPLLCSYAKQRPPLLADALYVVKRYSLDLPLLPRSIPSDILSTRLDLSQALSSSKSQKCFKYIAFLSNYQELFNAALGECDFDLARAIARQGGQMDPKVYLPLLQKMEQIEFGSAEPVSSSNDSQILVHLDVCDTALGTCPKQINSPYCLMRFQVYLHLNKSDAALDWGFACLESIAMKRATTNSTNDDMDLSQLVSDLLSIVTKNQIFVPCFPKLRNLRQKILSVLTNLPTPTTQTIGGLTLKLKKKTPTISESHSALLPVTSLLSKVFYAFGQHCSIKGEYAEAITAYLSSTEPLAPRGAVEAAIQNGDWLLALGLGGRFFDPNEANEEVDETPFFQNSQQTRSLDPKDIARELIDAFRSSLEQGGGEDAASEYYTLFQHNATKTGDVATTTGDHAMEASQLCLEYFDDVEGAIGILVLSKRWRLAAQLAARKRRLDLLREEVCFLFPHFVSPHSSSQIGSSLKGEVQQVMKILIERQNKHLELVEKITALWIDGPGRLKAVSEVDPGLLKAIQGRDLQDESEETRSDFGGGTSVYSNMSMLSSTSTSSVSSTLSMLSNLSEMESSTQSVKKKKDSNSFAIDGIEHNLLSRGKTDRTEFSQYDQHPKLKKRKQKMHSKSEGGGRDIFGLKQEGVMVRFLYNLGDIASVSITVAELCEVLLLVGGLANQLLACEVRDSSLISFCPQPPSSLRSLFHFFLVASNNGSLHSSYFFLCCS